MVADEPLERLRDAVGRYRSGRANGGDRTDDADGADLHSRVEVGGQRRFYLDRTGSNGEDVSVPLENVVSAAIWRETDLDRQEVPDVEAAIDGDRLAAVAVGDRDDVTLRVADHRVTVSGAGVVDVETRTSFGRRSVLKAATAAGLTGVTGLGIGGFLDDEVGSAPTFGYGGALVRETTEPSTATAATDEGGVAGGTTTAIATATETVTATTTAGSTDTPTATATGTPTDTPSDTPTETPSVTATDVPADVSVKPSGDTSVEPSGDTSAGPSGDTSVETEGPTETATSAETEGSTETDTYGVQGYGEYGYGGFA